MNPAKLKVVELRAELSARGLDTKGNKAVLVDRLQEALDKEGGGGDDVAAQSGEESSEEQNDAQVPAEKTEHVHEIECEPESAQQKIEETINLTPSKEQSKEGNQQPQNNSPLIKTEEVTQRLEPSPLKTPEKSPTKSLGDTPDKTLPTTKPEQQTPGKTSQISRDKTPEISPKKTPESSQKKSPESSPNKTPETSPKKTPETSLEKNREKTPEKSPTKIISAEKDDTPEDAGSMEVDETQEKQGNEKEKDGLEAIKEEKEDEEYSKQAENGSKDGYECDTKMEVKSEDDIKRESDVKSEHREYNDRKRKRSPSPQTKPARPMDREPDIKDDAVTLSWYDSDLNLTIDDKDFLSASPMSDGGFGYVWAGVRGTHGYTSGHICYQVKVTNYLDVTHLDDEPNPNLLRVGWSSLSTSLQLGEEPFSYGYGGTGKFSVACKFSDYGTSFALDDVVTCYLEFTSDEAILSYSLNDEYLGVAHRIQLETLNGQPLAPHILTKNSTFAVNFGQSEVPWSIVKEEATFLSKYPIEKAVSGPKRPEKRSDCEMIMMCGLPACGKTTWANKYVSEHPEKHYNILGTNALIDKMKVMGLPRKANYHGRWDVLIEKCTKCLQRLMDIGSHRRRNYILDQTNVYPAAQKRKMRNFEGFTRKAVVIVPTDEEFRSRTEKQAKEEKKDVPESAVLEMKANFTLPDKELFDEVTFIELDEDEAKEVIEKYSKEAADKGFFKKQSGPPAKRFRGGGSGSDSRPRNDFRRDRFPSGGPQSSPFRRGSDRGGSRGGSWSSPRGGNGPMDRWRDNRSSGSGGYGRPSGDRWRGQSGGSGGRGSSRDYDRGPPPSRSGGFDRNSRSSGGPPFRSGGGYNNRDQRDNSRGPPGNGHKSGPIGKPRSDSGKHGSGGNSGSWSNQSQNQGYGQSSTGGNQGGWGQQAQWDNNQAWNNYQQQWKGYQGYNQQQQQQQQPGYGQQGYNPQQYNWQQQYYGYNQQGGWGQNSDGSSYNYPQSWQNWYTAQNAGHQTNTSQPPPSAK